MPMFLTTTLISILLLFQLPVDVVLSEIVKGIPANIRLDVKLHSYLTLTHRLKSIDENSAFSFLLERRFDHLKEYPSILEWY